MAKERKPEIDLIRATAIILMIVYHTAYDLWAFFDWNINLSSTPWEALRITTASLFLFVSGVSSTLSRTPLKRAAIVLLCASIISLVTYIYDERTFIYFGILHCIGTGLLLLIPLKHLREWNTLLGLLVIILYPLSTIHYTPRPTLDFYPLLPWFGIMLIGNGIGNVLYRKNRQYKFKMLNLKFINGISKHSLLIYMLHQPLILLILHTIL